VRRLIAVAVLAASPLLAVPAHAGGVKDCDGQSACYCGTEIAVGLPGKDPIVTLGRIDC
jgi:hypothetical protein